jgi:hypothetical protein
VGLYGRVWGGGDAAKANKKEISEPNNIIEI